MVPMRIFLYYFDLLKDSSLVVTLTVSLGSLAVFRNYDKFSSAVSINHVELLGDSPKHGDYGCPIKPFFIEIQKFWAWADKLGR